MAEFCLDCFNEMNVRRYDGRPYSEDEVTLSWDLDLCEGCGEWKPVVVSLRPEPLVGKFIKKLSRLLDR